MKIHYVLHAPFEKLGAIRDWAEENNHTLTCTEAYRHQQLPKPIDFDFLLLMGGPQSACDIHHFPYLIHEIELIKESIQVQKHLLGICLGAQLIAEAFAAETMASPEKEVGTFPVQLTTLGQKDPNLAGFPQQLDVMHWHFDMAGLPDETEILATSDGCPHQILRFNQRTYGFQCHMEWNYDNALALIESSPSDLAKSKYTQTAEQILGSDFEKPNQLLKQFLSRFVNS